MRLTEHKLQSELLIRLSQVPGVVVWRNVVGTFKTMSGGQIVRVGKLGQADIFGMVDGRFLSIEVKAAKGRKRKEQVTWAKLVELFDGIHIWAQLAGLDDIDDDIDSVVREVIDRINEERPGPKAEASKESS